MGWSVGSIVLAGTGLVSLWLSGRPCTRRLGWIAGLVDEVLWIVYAVMTTQWAFIISALAYGWVYWKHLEREARMAQRDPNVIRVQQEEKARHSRDQASGHATGANRRTEPVLAKIQKQNKRTKNGK